METKTNKIMRDRKDKNIKSREEISKKVFEETKKDLIPNMQKKLSDVSEKVSNIIDKDNGLVATQIELILGERSWADICTINNKSFTASELLIGLELYRQAIAIINEKITYPPSIYTFCSFMGISTATYISYRADSERAEAIKMIDDYIAGIQFTSAQLGKIKEVITIFGLKSIHGLYEAQAPVQVKSNDKTDIDEIRDQIKLLKKTGIIEAKYEEK